MSNALWFFDVYIGAVRGAGLDPAVGAFHVLMYAQRYAEEKSRLPPHKLRVSVPIGKDMFLVPDWSLFVQQSCALLRVPYPMQARDYQPLVVKLAPSLGAALRRHRESLPPFVFCTEEIYGYGREQTWNNYDSISTDWRGCIIC